MLNEISPIGVVGREQIGEGDLEVQTSSYKIVVMGM